MWQNGNMFPGMVAAEIAALRAEVIASGMLVRELRRELHAAITPRPEPEAGVGHLISVAEASKLSRVSPQTIRNWADHGIGKFVANHYLVDKRLLRAHLVKRGGRLPAELEHEPSR